MQTYLRCAPVRQVWLLLLLTAGCGKPLFDGQSLLAVSGIAAQNGAIMPFASSGQGGAGDANTSVTTDANRAQAANVVVLSPNQTLVAATCNDLGYPFNTAKGGSAGVLSGGHTLDMAMDGSGNPVVAWLALDSDGLPQVFVQTWHQTAWAGYGGSNAVFTSEGISGAANGFGRVSDLTLAVDANGLPGVAWQNYSGTQGHVYYEQYNGSAWVIPSGNTPLLSSSTAQNNTISQIGLIFVAPGNPVLALPNPGTPGNAALNLDDFDGGAWADVSLLPPSSSVPLTNPTLALGPGGDPVVVYLNGGLFGAQRSLSGGTWSPVGPGLNTAITKTPDQVAPAVAVDNANRIVVAWQDSSRTGMPDIYLSRWNGSTWEDLGGSNTDGGVSRSVSGAQQPALAVDPQGNPALAWVDMSLRQIFVRHWNGTYWETLGAGQGLSKASSYASEPRIRFAPDGTMFLAWKLEDYYAEVCKVVQ